MPRWERAVHLRDQLVERGWRLDDNLNYKEVQGAERAEWAWCTRFEAVLRFLFPPLPQGRRSPMQKPMIAVRPFHHQLKTNGLQLAS